MIIGLTGLYCAGKNHVGRLLERRGIPVLDADKLGHEVILREAKNITALFGKKILGADGLINRRLLGKCAFGSPAELAALEAIVHPAVDRLAEEWLERQELQFRTNRRIAGTQRTGESSLCVLNAAMLHKSSIYSRLDAIIAVYAPFPVRFIRAAKRDKLPLKELLTRFSSQKEFPSYKTGGKTGKGRPQLFFPSADIYSIQNSGFSGSLRTLEKRIDAILEGLNHGKEKIIAGCGFGGGVPGGRGKRCDPDL